MSGIDYGMGKVNIDLETGIRYGIIHSNKLDSWAWEDMYSHGKDIGFREFKEQVCSEIKSAIERAIDDYTHNASRCVERLDIDEIFDACEFEYEGNGDSPRYYLEQDGYAIQTCDDGNWFVFKSDYYTLCRFCSPCVPGAGDLGSDGSVKAYCLGPEWFENDKPPYTVYRVADDTIVCEGVSE